MMLRGCGHGAALGQRLLVASAAQRSSVAAAAPGAVGLYRARQRRSVKPGIRDASSCRLFSTAERPAFGRSGVAATASRASAASTSGRDGNGERASGASRGSAVGAAASTSSQAEEDASASDEEAEEGEEEGKPTRGGRPDPRVPVKMTLQVPTPRGLKELLMVGNVIVEPSLAEMIEPADNQRITQSEYMQSCVSLAACPPPKYPEFAFIGRSNVGKSSLINLITGRKALAMVSKTPGARFVRTSVGFLQYFQAPRASVTLPLHISRRRNNSPPNRTAACSNTAPLL